MTATDDTRFDAPTAAAVEPPLVVLRAGFGDPLSLAEAHLLDTRTVEILAALVRLARSARTEDVRVYLGESARAAKDAIVQEVGRLSATDAAVRIEVHEVALPWVCAEVTAFLRALQGDRPVPDFSMSTAGPAGEIALTLSGRPVVVADPVTLVAGEGLLADSVFTLAGDIASPRVVEAPAGTTLRELVYGYGGGVAEGRELKAVVVGGPVGGLLPSSLLDLPATDDALQPTHAGVGTGTVRVIAEPACAVALAKVAMDALAEQSCGKCVCCREGTMQMAEIIGDISAGAGRSADLDLLLELARALQNLGTCEWGRSAATPVLSALTHFRQDFDVHVRNKTCPAGVCKRRAV
jgi:NADH:ubiquinone oxidoreductase subunit F (NADH-binding)